MADRADWLEAFGAVRAALLLGAGLLAYEDFRAEEAAAGVQRPLITRIELTGHGAVDGLAVTIGDRPYRLLVVPDGFEPTSPP